MTPTVIAHRGFAGVNPENTVGAVHAAAADADRIEIDVVACGDGTPVVFHDTRLDDGDGSRGITDGDGAVHESSPATVTAATVGPSDETVPTLARLVETTDVPLNVELKRPATAAVRSGALSPADRAAARERWQPFVDRVFETLDDREILFSSFCEGALAAVRDRDATAPLAPICHDLSAGRDLAARYDTTAIHPSLAAVRAAETADADPDLNVWTIRTWDEAVEAVRLGADGIIADYPGLTQWLGA